MLVVDGDVMLFNPDHPPVLPDPAAEDVLLGDVVLPPSVVPGLGVLGMNQEGEELRVGEELVYPVPGYRFGGGAHVLQGGLTVPTPKQDQIMAVLGEETEELHGLLKLFLGLLPLLNIAKNADKTGLSTQGGQSPVHTVFGPLRRNEQKVVEVRSPTGHALQQADLFLTAFTDPLEGEEGGEPLPLRLLKGDLQKLFRKVVQKENIPLRVRRDDPFGEGEESRRKNPLLLPENLF